MSKLPQGDWVVQYCTPDNLKKQMIFAGYKDTDVPKYAVKYDNMMFFRSSKLAMETAIQLQKSGKYFANVCKIHSLENGKYYLTRGY
jgi:hypothetical protein